MADYKTHFIGGVAAGVVTALTSAACGWIDFNQIPLVAMTGMVGGIAPDIDSDSSRAQQILFNIGMLVVPSAIVFRILPWLPGPEYALGAWILLALMRFPVQWFFQKFTVHRGMCHSIPAGVIFALLCFMFGGRGEEDAFTRQVANGLAGGIGYFTHIALDELWSVDFDGRKIYVKKSLGTAYKLWGNDVLPNLSTYGLLLVVSFVVWSSAPVSSWTELVQALRPSEALLSAIR